MRFEDLGLAPEILRAVADAGYVEPTPIQEQAIPIVLQGRDMIGIAQTGTGKTAAFTLPLLDILAGGRAKARMPRSIILTPTRELATQISENFEIYGKYHKLTMALLIGGVSIADQESVLSRGVDVLIATPGRLIDLFERGRILFAGVKILVIDESDRMLDMGFIPDVERIAGLLPPLRQTLLFSATMPMAIRRLAERFMHNPKEVKTDPPASPAEMVEHVIAPVSPRDKLKALTRLLAGEQVKNGLIFCNRKRDVDQLSRALKAAGFQASALHGDMPQSARTETLEGFKNGDIRFLVATDVAGRGIDVFGLSHVFNYDVPYNAEDYVHRIGRTGRAGHRGHAVMLATPEEAKFVAAIRTLIGRSIPRIEIPGVSVAAGDESAAEASPRATGGRNRGRRGSSRGGSRGAKPSRAETPRAETPRAEAPPGSAPPASETPEAPAPKSEPSPGKARPRRRAAKAASKTPSEPKAKSEPKAGSASRNRDGQGGKPVVGMGDHMPAFMRRK